MQRYWYRGIDASGRRLRGQIMAADEKEAMERLKEKGCQVVALKALAGRAAWGGRRLSAGEAAPICRQLGMLLSSGVSLLRGLQMMRDDQYHPKTRLWLEGLLTQITGGQTLTRAMGMSVYQAPPVLVELVAVGERQGTLGEVLLQASAYFERERKWRSELVTALLYPALVLAVIIAAVTAMLIFVVPALLTTYQSLGAPMPWLTRGFIAMSQFLRRYGVWLGGGCVLAVVLAVQLAAMAREHENWRAVYLAVMAHLPRLKRWLAEQYYTQFAQMLGQLLAGGVLLIDGLGIVREHYRGIVFADELQELFVASLKGRSLTESLAGCSFVPQAALSMLHTGEEAGRLSEMLLASGNYYGERLNERLTRLVKMIEPLLIIVLGLLILLIAGSLFLPIISSYRYIG